MVEAILLVALVIFVFLRSLRATIIPLVTIPLSLIGTFTLLLYGGVHDQCVDTLAMVLAIGLVVDDAIVCVENIHRHIEEGMKPFEAALKGSKEIGFCDYRGDDHHIGGRLCTALLLGQTRTDRLFIEFALALAGGGGCFRFVALTLSPMMLEALETRAQARPNLQRGGIGFN